MSRRPLPESFDFIQNRQQFRANARQQSSLLKLSPEVLLLIFGGVAHPRDQVAFMLSCKGLAATTRSIKLNTIQAKARSAGNYLSRLYDHRDLIEDLYRHAFIPKFLQLCIRCEKYLPVQRIWRDVYGIPIRDLEYVDWISAVVQWTKGGKVCPTCQIGHVVEGEDWLQGWGEGFVQGVLVRRKVEEGEVR